MALGVGLLIGAERERRKQERPSPSAAGIRTFTVATLAGAVAQLVGGVLLLAVVAAADLTLGRALVQDGDAVGWGTPLYETR